MPSKKQRRAEREARRQRGEIQPADGMTRAERRRTLRRPPLETLLEAGEADLYGRLCWSIANRGTELPRSDEVIGFGGKDGEGVIISKEFRLTPRSVENIERCMGMRTCGEAVAMFAEKKEPEVDSIGDCPHGHQEAALAFMLYGIRPTEPCPRCGEIPEFGNASMSPDWYLGESAKGVDGQEYTACPRCGDDFLQLEGESIADWGWKIVCVNCGWEMKQAESLDIAQYCDLMEEVKSRVESIDHLMEMPGLTIRTRVESICLQLRMLLELIAFSSLVSNKDVWRESQKELQSSQNLSKKIRELKRIHPNFYPKPVDLQESPLGKEPTVRSEGFLSEEKLLGVYGRLGNILHAGNPLGKETDYPFFIDAVPGWLSEIKNLLECHKVYLLHRPEEFYLIKMFGDVDGELMPIRFETTAEGETKCAWPDCVSSSGRLYCEYIQQPWRKCRLRELEPDQTQAKREVDVFDQLAQ